MQFPVSHLSGRFDTEDLELGHLFKNLETPRLSERVDNPDTNKWWSLLASLF